MLVFGVVQRVKGRRTDKVAAYGTETGKWTGYEIPVAGEEIAQIAKFVPTAGRWYPID